MINIFILTGQSNAQGCIEDGEPVASDAIDADRKIAFTWHLKDGRGERLLCSSGGSIQHLQTQFFDDGSGLGHWGLEISCFRELQAKGLDDILIIKVTRGGGSNTCWLKSAPDKSMYQAIVSVVEETLSEIRRLKKPFEFAGLLYLQGESDGTFAAVAGERAADLLDNLKSEFPNTGSMQMYIGGIAGFGPQRDLTRNKHREIATKRNDIHFIETQDLLESHQYKDQLHFNNAAKTIIGHRFAKAILQSVSYPASMRLT